MDATVPDIGAVMVVPFRVFWSSVTVSWAAAICASSSWIVADGCAAAFSASVAICDW
jgi:hypothetical protein